MDTLKKKMLTAFARQFGGGPEVVVRSPGRVNLIGEHTDYNAGYVMPFTIDRCMVFGMSSTDTGRGRFYAVDEQEGYETDLSSVLTKSSLDWPNYLLGVITVMQHKYRGSGFFSGVDVVFTGDVPVGTGLSSSAALTTGMACGLNELFGRQYDRSAIARIAQRAENNFVGMRCGIMDPFVNLHGTQGHVLMLDCRSLEYEELSLELGDSCLVICDSGIRRDLSTSEYNLRREQCEQAVTFLQARGEQIQALRDVDIAMIEKYREEMEPVLHRRCSFVIEENERVLQAADQLKAGKQEGLGALLTQSHAGLRDLYEVSCPEIDFLVEEALGIEGVLGARMVGGGFGGSTLNLVREEAADAFRSRIRGAYEEETGKKPSVFTVHTASGTEVTRPGEQTVQ